MEYILNQTKAHQRHLEALCRIPHPSMKEKGVSDYVVEQAKRLGLPVTQDRLWNVVVKKPAFPGYEQAPSVMLQAHLDMVTVKSPESNHDFDTDPLQLWIDEEGNLRARDTTLGADDGYGVAYLLAVMEENFPHPPLELVFTTQEENGCFGVDFLDTSLLTSRRMIGLDVMGEDHENVCVTGCFYSDKLVASTTYEETPADGTALKIIISGLQPVRTVKAVHPEQFNAIKIMARLLHDIPGLRLVSMSGGEAENYSPLMTEAVIVCEDADQVIAALWEQYEIIKDELEDGVQNMQMEVQEMNLPMKAQEENLPAGSCQAAEAACSAEKNGTIADESRAKCLEVLKSWTAASPEDTVRILDFLFLMPCNCVELEPKEETMTAFNNIGVITMKEGSFALIMSDRTAKKSYLTALSGRIRTLCRLCSMTLDLSIRYASWDYIKDSQLLNKTAELMQEFYGAPMEESICPGGLECCSLIPKMPGLDVVMFAPIGSECHSTGEFLNLASFDRVYEFLKILLGRLEE